MKKLIVLISLASLFGQCSTPYTAEIVIIDSLLVQLDSAKIQLNQVDTGMVFARTKQATSNLLKVNQAADTISKEDALLLDRYGSYLKAYRRWTPKIGVMTEQLEVVPRQLENLRTDLSKNLIDEEKAAQYMNNETMAVVSLVESVKQMKFGLQSIDQAFMEADEKVLLLIERLESQNQNQP